MLNFYIIQKSKKLPIGTVSKGRRKVAEGKWVAIKHRKKVNKEAPVSDTPVKDTGKQSVFPAGDKKISNKGYIEVSENLGFGGDKINWNKVSKKDAARALGQSKGMSKALYEKLRLIESGKMNRHVSDYQPEKKGSSGSISDRAGGQAKSVPWNKKG